MGEVLRAFHRGGRGRSSSSGKGREVACWDILWHWPGMTGMQSCTGACERHVMMERKSFVALSSSMMDRNAPGDVPLLVGQRWKERTFVSTSKRAAKKLCV